MSKLETEQSEQTCSCEEPCVECSCEESCHECMPESETQEELIAELNDKLLRTQAEMINYRNRKEEECSRLLKYQGSELIINLLPVIDDFERAIMMDDDNLGDEVSKFLQGFKMMYANFENILRNHEVTAMDCLHKPFDPHFHQAVLTDKKENYESGVITEVLAKGYMYKDRVLRPAMVKVNE